MCLILDADMYGEFFKPDNEDMEPVKKWLNGKKGKIAYSPTEKIKKELNKSPRMKDQFTRLMEKGKLKKFDEEVVQNVQNNLQDLKSDDPHIVALAIVAKVKILISRDEKLWDDFRNPKFVKGKIYQYASHKHLLTRDPCP